MVRSFIFKTKTFIKTVGRKKKQKNKKTKKNEKNCDYASHPCRQLRQSKQIYYVQFIAEDAAISTLTFDMVKTR